MMSKPLSATPDLTELRSVLERYLEAEQAYGPDVALNALGFALVNAAITVVYS